MLGQIISDRYQLQQSLGRSGQQTFLALDLQTQQLVVLKLLKFGGDLNWEQVRLFEREASILQQLSHPAIPRYLDSFELDLPQCKGFALVQTYLEARSLEEHLQAGRSFSESEIRQVAEQLLEILAYLHTQKPAIVHRDIKPSNVLLRDRSGHRVGQVYLVDFGAVQNLIAAKGSTITVVGTYGYMPPEQFGGRATPASDLYSLGATLVYLVTGIHPADLPQENLRIRFEAKANLSPAFSRWLRKMIEPSLERRFQSVPQALQALRHPEAVVSTRSPDRPLGTRIRLSKNQTTLTISLPQPAIEAAVPLPSVRGWGCLLAFLLSYVWILWLAIAVVNRVAVSLISYLLEKQISFGSRWVKVSYTLCGFVPLLARKMPLQQVSQLERREASYQKSDWGYLKNQAEITLWLGNYPCTLKKLGGLTTPELDWLEHELSDWFEVPVRHQNIQLTDLHPPHWDNSPK
ncbi:serine/threonine protein kinase [Almyronema epifaneia]|uniref:Serine/threonine protein kinase n=1 Tax=Almyronema epifaneia S1 TaxID=2991925 RepID=A0ABW6IG41_9CYAN